MIKGKYFNQRSRISVEVTQYQEYADSYLPIVRIILYRHIHN